MPLVVFLKGINVGGHRALRPAALARALARYDVANVGAAGTFVVRGPVSRATFRAELRSRLPFDASIMCCDGRDLRRLIAADPFAGHRPRPDVIPFVSVLERRPSRRPPVPIDIPDGGRWCVRVLARHDRFVVGLHRREMRAIACLGELETLFGVKGTTRSWSTVLSLVPLLGARTA